ncbi:hypothetical protein [Mesorhizobium sp. ORM16]|uniref:hypothetical protein n=1 Tax=Mesorhizobium sp. ORM16 TaxID=3376989 RepID=UPI0038574159
MTFGIPFTPPQASSIAGSVDALFYVLLAFTVALGVFLTSLVVFYAIKYRAGSKVERTGSVRAARRSR